MAGYAAWKAYRMLSYRKLLHVIYISHRFLSMHSTVTTVPDYVKLNHMCIAPTNHANYFTCPEYSQINKVTFTANPTISSRALLY